MSLQRRPGSAGVIVMPTYNERANLERIVPRVRAAAPDLDLLVVDDGSPDGTGAYADELRAADPAIHVLHRTSKEGLGAAYVAGFRLALAAGYPVIGEMDADGSHLPEELPRLRAALTDADLVVGARWIPGGEVRNWSRRRIWLSRGGNTYARLLLAMPVRDATSGYRLFRASALTTIDLDTVHSTGYVFQTDLVHRALAAGLRVREVPITFVDRVEGESKMSTAVAVESLARITAWGVRDRWDRRRGRAGPAG